MKHQWAHGKSEHKFTYTYSDISKATGLSNTTIRIYASKNKFNPTDLLSVIKFINEKLATDKHNSGE